MHAKLILSLTFVMMISVDVSILGELIWKGTFMLKSLMAVMTLGVAQVRILGRLKLPS